MAFVIACPTGGLWPRLTRSSASEPRPAGNGTRLFKGFNDVADKNAQRGPHVRVVEIPRRQLGVDAVVGAAQRVERSGDEQEQSGREHANGQMDRYLRGRFGGVHAAARQIEHVADFQAHVSGRRERVGGDRLMAQRRTRRDIDTVVQVPDL